MTGRVVIIMVVEQYQYCTFTLPIRVREREEHKNRALQQQHMKQRIVFAPCYMYTYWCILCGIFSSFFQNNSGTELIAFE